MFDQNNSLYLSDLDDFYKELNYSDSLSEFDLDYTTLPCEPIPFAALVNISVCVFYVLVFLLALPGNLIVGLIIGLSKDAVLPYDVYLLHLMLADSLLALVLPISAAAVVHGWLFRNAMCKLVSLLKRMNFYSSILFLVCISVDRYKAVIHPTEARRALCSRAVSGAVWLCGCLLSVPAAYYNESFRPSDGEKEVCAERYHPDSADAWRLATRVISHLLGFLLPLLIMLWCYSKTVAGLRRTSLSNQKPMRVIVAVVVAFLLCWTPFHVATMADTLLRARVVQHSCETRTAVDVALFTTQNLGLLHCCVNPVLYAFVVRKYRRRFLRLLSRVGLLTHCPIPQLNRSTTSQSSETPM